METSLSMETPIYRKAKKMNHTLKKMLAKQCQETHLKWNKVLLIALLCILVAPRSGLGIQETTLTS